MSCLGNRILLDLLSVLLIELLVSPPGFNGLCSKLTEIALHVFILSN